VLDQPESLEVDEERSVDASFGAQLI